MDNFEEILSQLRNEHGKIDSILHIIEKAIPIEEQMEYFNWAKNVRTIDDIHHKSFWIATLFTPEIDINKKKDALSILAGLPNVAAYRAIETYNSSPLEAELANWSIMAFTESKMLLNSDLSGEKQVLISTGLGGMKSKLRFFSVIVTSDKQDYTDLQKEILTKELQFQFNQNQMEVEEFRFVENFVKIIFLATIEQNIKSIFNKIIDECNCLGCNLSKNFLLTNIKIFKDEEIRETLNK